MIIKSCLHCKVVFRARENKQKFCTLTCSNRHNLNGLKLATLPFNSTELAEFCGIYLGDGTRTKYQVGITLNSIADYQYVHYVHNLMYKLFPGPNLSLINRSDENATVIRINSRIVSEFVEKLCYLNNKKSIPKWISKKDSYIKAFIRGLFDTEGSISFKIYKAKKTVAVYKQLNFRNYDLELIRFVLNNLSKLGFKPTKTLKTSLYISNRIDIDRFRNEIGLSNPKLFTRSLISDFNTYISYLEELRSGYPRQS